jgi:hypothetical protein
MNQSIKFITLISLFVIVLSAIVSFLFIYFLGSSNYLDWQPHWQFIFGLIIWAIVRYSLDFAMLFCE